MMLIAGQYPDADNGKDGMVRRIAAIDDCLAEVERVYVTFWYSTELADAVPVVRRVAARTSKVELNLFDPRATALLLKLAKRCSVALVHSVYWAEHLLPLYRVRPVITDLHGLVPEESLMSGAPAATAEHYQRVEAFVLQHGWKALTVSDQMTAHFKKKFPGAKAEFLTLPVTTTPPEAHLADRRGPVRVVYSGGSQVWQNVDLMLAAAARSKASFAFDVLTPNGDAFRAALVKNKVKRPVEISSLAPELVPTVLAQSHYGFVLRDAHPVNQAACPTKLHEYLSWGVVPIVLSPDIGDFADLGYRYVTLEALRAGQLPSAAQRNAMAAHNFSVAAQLNRQAQRARVRLLNAVKGPPMRRRKNVEPLKETWFGNQPSVFSRLQEAKQLDGVLRRELDESQAEVSRLHGEVRLAQLNADVLKQELEAIKNEKLALLGQLEASRGHERWMENSLSWKWTAPLRTGNQLRRRVARSARGLLERPAPQASALTVILEANPGLPLVISRPLLDWNWPLLQRPHHLALSLGQQQFIYFFVTPNHADRVDGYRQVGERCYVTNQLDEVLAAQRKKFFHVCSTDLHCDVAAIDVARRAGARVLYDYIDELDEAIAGQPIPPSMRERHRAMVADESVICVVSATRLLDEVRAHRKSNFGLVTNGVAREHFANARRGVVPGPLERAVKTQRPLIGYFGALAQWVDYGLIEHLARVRPELEVVLLGLNYDGSLDRSKILDLPNVTFYGPVPWAELPSHAAFFDVATIPFAKSAVTESTSPIKLFEYMALGKPIVTTDLRECRRYRSPLIGRSHGEFVERVDEALSLRTNEPYLATLRLEAEQNSWASKARTIANLLQAN